MLRFRERLSPHQRFWAGFACCPLIVGFSLLALLLVSRIHWSLGFQWVFFTLIFCAFSGLVMLAAIALLSGFCAAYFWSPLIPIPTQEIIGFWSVLLTWFVTFLVGVFYVAGRINFLSASLEVMLRLGGSQGVPVVLFVGFIILYCVGLWKGNTFWNTNRPRHWVGDFSDMS